MVDCRALLDSVTTKMSSYTEVSAKTAEENDLCVPPDAARDCYAFFIFLDCAY